MRIFGHGYLYLLASLLLLSCSTTGQLEPHPFKVTHVTAYDCGLAQLERRAEVDGAQQLEIALDLAHMDDFLGSLMLATDGSVKVKGVKFPAVLNMAQARAASGFATALWNEDEEELTIPHSLESYVEALMGTSVRVALKDGRSADGTVLDFASGRSIVADSSGTTENTPPDGLVDQLLLVGDDGSLRWIPLNSVERLTPRSQREAEAVRKFAKQLGKANGLEQTSVVVQTAAGSKGSLAAGYVRQAPVWRMNYKFTASGDRIVFEAWGLVHNDTNEAWDDVNLTLVSGLPTSYVMSLASPRYVEREALYTDEGLEMFPQLGAATPDSLLYDQGGISALVSSASYAFGSGSGGGSSGFASRGYSASGVMGGGSGEAESSLLALGTTAVEETAEPQVEKEISTYRALEKVSIPGRSSNMVPLLRRELPGQVYTAVGSSHSSASTCLRMENNTGLVLQYGVSSFYINGRFRGQAELQRTEPGDTRVLCFGEDPDLEWDVSTDAQSTPKALEWRHGQLWAHYFKRTEMTYTITNKAGQARRVAVDFTHRSNGRTLKPASYLEGEDGWKMSMVDVGPRSEIQTVVEIEEGIMSTAPLVSWHLLDLSKKADLPAEHREIAAKGAVAYEEIEALQAEVTETAARQDKVRAAIGRMKDNLAAVPKSAGSSRVIDRMLSDLLTKEDSLEKLLRRKDELEEEIGKLDARARKLMSSLER